MSKTITTFNLGWKLAELGKRVILVDGDPQCNLTGMILGYRGADEFENFYRNEPDRNIRSALAPAFEARPQPIRPVNCLPVRGRDGLFVLPGHINLSEYEVTLGIAHNLSGPLPTLQNLPGSINHLMSKTAEAINADFILIDLNPSLSSFNQNFLMTSDFFIVPTSPDYFSVMAIDSLSSILPKWRDWADNLVRSRILSNADYKFPDTTPKFLRTIIQKFRTRGGGATAAFQEWINEIEESVVRKLKPALSMKGMALQDTSYEGAGLNEKLTLVEIPDFNSLIALSQREQTPVFSLSREQLRYPGVVLEQYLASQQNFQNIFQTLAHEILRLTTDADGSRAVS